MGDVIAKRYRLVKLLGEGGNGTVWMAEHVDLGKRVALKVLRAEYSAQEEYRIRFLREAKVSSKIHHPGVVGVHDFGEHAGALYLVMDLLDGRTLRTAFRGGALPVEDAKLFIRELAAVLDVAHQVPLVHRDLKPENVILLPLPGGGERPVVVDFGLAFVAAANPKDTDIGRMTTDGSIAGTPLYMAPEQAMASETIGPETDIYALGCILFEALTGKTPFEGGATQLLGMHMYVEASPPSSVHDDPAVAALDDLVLAMLAKQAFRRPLAREVVDALGGAPISQLRASAHARAPMVESESESTQQVEPSELPPVEVLAAAWRSQPSNEMLLAAKLCGVALERRDVVANVHEKVALATEATPAEIAELVAAGHRVIAGTKPGDMPRIVELLRAGAYDVVTLPLDPVEAVAKVRRAARAK